MANDSRLRRSFRCRPTRSSKNSSKRAAALISTDFAAIVGASHETRQMEKFLAVVLANHGTSATVAVGVYGVVAVLLVSHLAVTTVLGQPTVSTAVVVRVLVEIA